MPLTLTPAEVESWTDTTVPAAAITVAAEQIDACTGYTVDEHNTDRDVSADSVRFAWALVAVRVHNALKGEADLAVTSESENDYSYSEDAALAKMHRFGGLVGGRPSELLEIPRGAWHHV